MSYGQNPELVSGAVMIQAPEVFVGRFDEGGEAPVGFINPAVVRKTLFADADKCRPVRSQGLAGREGGVMRAVMAVTASTPALRMGSAGGGVAERSAPASRTMALTS